MTLQYTTMGNAMMTSIYLIAHTITSHPMVYTMWTSPRHGKPYHSVQHGADLLIGLAQQWCVPWGVLWREKQA